jgi:hypothetical protein
MAADPSPTGITYVADDAPRSRTSNSSASRSVMKTAYVADDVPTRWASDESEKSYVEDGGDYSPYGGTFDGSCDSCGGGDCGCCDTCEVYDGGYGCGDACCETGCCDTCGPCCDCGPTCSVFVDFLYLQVTDADVTHAQQQNGIGGAGTVPFGEIGTIGMDYNTGVRIGGILGCDPCSAATFSFTNFESDAFSSLEPPVITGGGGAVGSLVHHPGAVITASNGPVDAEYEVDFQIVDLMYRHRLLGDGCCYSVNYMLGVQYGHLEQDFMQSGVFGGGSSGTLDTTTTIDFHGGGLKAGVDAERYFGGCFSAYGRATATAMSGRFQSRYTMNNSTTATLLAQANWDDDRVVTQVEGEIGFALTTCNKHWRWATGYMFSHWANVVNTTEFIDAVQLDYYGDVSGSIGFDGLVTRLEARW